MQAAAKALGLAAAASKPSTVLLLYLLLYLREEAL
jgi:hypothetical protein